ncbi:general stress protein 16O [bacterium BMS3Abin02]|nr:general stress protein 16O [bacterium BMS3Abin02]
MTGAQTVNDMDIARTLQERKQVLEAELARLVEPPVAGTNLSFGKRIGDGTTEAVERINTTAAARSLAASLTATDRALTKLDEGTYGICDVCGEPIPPERLEARPTTATCVDCSRQGTANG